MDLRQLRYFIKVVECGNVTRASELLHIAQPAVSQQIRNLEVELETILLSRMPYGVMPTEAGKTLYHHAVMLLQEADRTKEILKLDAEVPQGRVSVGLPSSTSKAFSLPLINAVLKHYPGIVLELLEIPTADMLDQLQNGRIDLAITADADEIPGLCKQPLFMEELCLVVWPEFELNQKPIHIMQIARMPLILPSAPNSIRIRMERAIKECGLPCNILFEVSSISLLFAAVQEKIGVSLLPRSVSHLDLVGGRVRFIQINHKDLRRELSLCWKKNIFLSNAAIKIKDIILDMSIEMPSQ